MSSELGGREPVPRTRRGSRRCAASSSDCSMTTRSDSSPATGAAGGELAGRAAELDLEPPAAVVGSRLAPELDRADLGDPRGQADRHALGLRLAADAHQALQAAAARGSSRVGAHQVAGLVVGPDRAAGQRETRPAGPSRGRSRGRRSRSRPPPGRRAERRRARACSAAAVSSPT